MVRFAHIADVHLGAFRDARLRELNLRAFEMALDECAKKNVDFVIIAGDLFDINIPDLGVVERAVRKMRQLARPIYAVYGSHDYSPTQTSVIDVLNEAGVLTKVSSGKYMEVTPDHNSTLNNFNNNKEKKENEVKKNTLKLDVLEDSKTGVKITGISARKLGLEKTYFADLDVAPLEALKGPKIFVFHCAINEHKPTELARVDAVPLSFFPKGFDYYAGGHVHARLLADFGHGKIAYPGPLFAADYRDLEEIEKTPHGFYIVDLNEKGSHAEFVSLKVANVRVVRVNAEEKTAEVANALLQEECLNAPYGDIGLLQVRGTLSQGKPSDLYWTEARETLEKKCPIVYVNRHALESKERSAVRVDVEEPNAVAEKVFAERLAETTYSEKLFGTQGVLTSIALLNVLKEENTGENRKRWEEIVVEKSKTVLDF